MKFLGCKQVWAFVGGVAASGLIAGLAQAKCVRGALVSATAKAMIVKDNVAGAVQSIKDEAEDVTADAREEAKLISLQAEKEAEIEKRVRAEVEQEMAKEKKTRAKTK